MADSVNIYKRLQEIRVELQNLNLTKSGHNDYSHYDYFELSDFLPAIQKLSLEKGIVPLYGIEADKAMLHLCDVNDATNRITFSIPTADAAVKGANAIQAVGSLTTYTRRYLYMIAFEIAENDDFDRTQISENLPQNYDDVGNDLIDNAKIKAIKAKIAAKGLGEDSILEYSKVKDFHDMTLKMWMYSMQILDKYPDKSESEE